jgi:hypothetical protein
MSGGKKAFLSLAVAVLIVGLVLPGQALAQQAGPAPAKTAPDCCPDLSPYYPKNQAAPPAKSKKRRAQKKPTVKVDKGWSTVQGQESAPAQTPK